MSTSKWFRVGILALVACCIAHAADVLISQRGPYLSLAYKAAWGNSGQGGTDNNYIFTPLDPNQGMCLFVSNNDTSSHSFTLAVYQTGDPNVVSYSNSAGRFAQNSIVGTISPVGPGATASAFVHSSAAARVSVNISGSSGTGTADIYVVETSSGSCGPVASGLTATQGAQASNTTLATNPITVAGVNGGTILPLLTDSSGYLLTKSQSALTPTCSGAGSIPTTLTAVGMSGQHYVVSLYVANTTASAIAFTLEDQGNPVAYFSSVNVQGNQTMVVSTPGGLGMYGAQWQASAAGLTGNLCWY